MTARRPDGAGRTLRVLLVDDSDAIRAELRRVLESAPDVEVAGAARDGEEALREALRLEPDVVVLDLQMPRMDGFTFLRLLMARRPTPVVVVSAQAGRADAFKALELGALDFVAKPEGGALAGLGDALLEKLGILRALRIENLQRPAAAAAAPRPGGAGPAVEAARVVLVGASTGGPQAIPRLLAGLPADLPVAVLVAQHMPERFTGAFAERLGRTTAWSAQEAADGDLVAPGRVLVAPGGRDLELVRDAGGALRAAVRAPGNGAAARYTPSVDRLFRSAAVLLGRRAAAVVLTGMGRDGRDGIVAMKRAGGLTLAESAASAVVFGMPHAAAESGHLDALLDLDRLAVRLAEFARG